MPEVASYTGVAGSPDRVPRQHTWPWLAAVAGYLAITAVMMWPLILAARTSVTHPPDDPLLIAWILSWNTQQLPLSAAWWNAPFFYPTPGVMAFAETLIGLMPIAAPVLWASGQPLVAANIAFILSFPLCAIAAHALAVELTGRHDAGWLAGLAFGFSPLRASELGHVQVLSYYWAPVALLALHRYVRTDRRRWLVVFACAWMLQIFSNGYALFNFSVLIALWAVWFASSPRQAMSIAGALALGTLPMVPVLLKYREVQSSLRLERSLGDIRQFSADVAAFFSVAPESAIWAGLLGSAWYPGLFPGGTILVAIAALIAVALAERTAAVRIGWDRLAAGILAVVFAGFACSYLALGEWSVGPLKVDSAYKPFSLAIVASVIFAARGPLWREAWRTRSTAAFYAASAACLYILSLGPEPRFRGAQVFYKAPYAWLMMLPGFNSIRAPSRFAMLAVLCVAIALAILYARRLAGSSWQRPLWIALAIGLVADGWINLHLVSAPAAGPATDWTGVRAVLELPVTPERNASALYRAIGSKAALVNGTSGYYAPHYPALTDALARGDLDVIEELYPYGPIGIAIDRSAPESEGLERAVANLPGVSRLKTSDGWFTFVTPKRDAAARTAMGAVVTMRGVAANRHVEEAGRMIDGDAASLWSADDPQDGGEEVTLELEQVTAVGGITLRHARCPFGFPRDLQVEVSQDGGHWSPVWRGRTAVHAFRAALADPPDVPLAIEFPAAQAKFVRLRQFATDPSPWCISEATVHAPTGGRE